MSITPVKEKAETARGRAGTQALSLLAVPINVAVLQSLAEGPKSLMDLRRDAGSSPQTTMRGYLRTLTETRIVIRQRQNDFPGSLDFELSTVGQELWVVARVLDGWLRTAPKEPLELGSRAAQSAVRALVEGWGTSMIRALAAKPLSLTELNGLISGISYPSLERRLGAMRLAGQIERTSGAGQRTPYAVTEWLRHAIAPLAAAARWERVHAAAQTSAIRRLDIEAAFLLAVPLLELPAEVSGCCRFAVEIPGGEEQQLAGVLVKTRQGRVVSCVTGGHGHADAWASGSARAWLQAIIEQDTEQLELGGDHQLARALLDSLHAELFGAGRRERLRQ